MLESRLKRMDTKIDKRFNKVKSFFGILWDAISCSTSISAQDPGKRPAPPAFNWSSTEESAGTSGHGRGESSREDDDEEDDDDDEEEDDQEETASDSS